MSSILPYSFIDTTSLGYTTYKFSCSVCEKRKLKEEAREELLGEGYTAPKPEHIKLVEKLGDENEMLNCNLRSVRNDLDESAFAIRELRAQLAAVHQDVASARSILAQVEAYLSGPSNSPTEIKTRAEALDKVREWRGKH